MKLTEIVGKPIPLASGPEPDQPAPEMFLDTGVVSGDNSALPDLASLNRRSPNNLLVVGINYRGAPEILAAASAGMADVSATLSALMGSPNVSEAVALSTCNRVEIYAAVDAFHGALNDMVSIFVRRGGVPLAELAPHLYVHYDDDAVRHLFTVASGLDSLVMGETQVLGQVRTAYNRATELGTVGVVLHEAMQRALRAGKRVHTQTLSQQTAPSMVDLGLDLGGLSGDALTGGNALVLGAGEMGELAAVTLRSRGVVTLRILSRSRSRAVGLAREVGADAGTLDELGDALRGVDVVVCATGSPDPVLTVDAAAARLAEQRPLLVVDLAMPRDTESALVDAPGVRLVDLAELASRTSETPLSATLISARRILSEELAEFTERARAASVTPTIVALRSRAEALIERELAALDARRPSLDAAYRADTERALRRVVNALLHDPTVRVKAPDGAQYASALAELFDLADDPSETGISA